MAWETRAGSANAYYTRSRKVRGRVVREYVGAEGSPTAAIAAAEDEMRREAKERSRLELASLGLQDLQTDAPLEALMAVGEALLGATLVISGHYRHDRGPWRRRRG
jgi:hypothetical protein